MPLALDGALLVEVVTLLEMSLGVSLSAGHCANREHNPTLTLFEIQDQLDDQVSCCSDQEQYGIVS
jgi:hypothetical protein